MKLYFATGTCSLTPQIILREADCDFEMVKVDLRTKLSAEGDYKQINPKGYVPALVLDNGEVLTEVAVIVQWLADQAPAKNLFPKFGTMERYHAMEWLNFVATEFHKGIGALFNAALPEECKPSLIDKLHLRFEVLDRQLGKKPYILGPIFSIVDAYAFNVLRWTKRANIEMSRYKGIPAFLEKVARRPAVQAAMAAEGLKP